MRIELVGSSCREVNKAEFGNFLIEKNARRKTKSLGATINRIVKKTVIF